jgi:hypothetical protein
VKLITITLISEETLLVAKEIAPHSFIAAFDTRHHLLKEGIALLHTDLLRSDLRPQDASTGE